MKYSRMVDIMSMVTMTFEVETELYNQFKAVCDKCGLTVEEACILFFKETIARGTIPFSYTQEDLRM
ncbi:MAG: hypothetical protein E7582_04755 [Ruminococcaceae bacterium]|nr:hypothetical protein [Oscillospiraceae bacterium]